MRWFKVVRRRVRRRPTKGARAHYLAHKEEARARILPRLVHWAHVYGVSYGRVAIRDQGTRWGSCSKKGNLNFNYRIAFIDPALMDYVIVHEVCHLIHFNHGSAFWQCVAQTTPEYAECVGKLKKLNLREIVGSAPSVVEV